MEVYPTLDMKGCTSPKKQVLTNNVRKKLENFEPDTHFSNGCQAL